MTTLEKRKNIYKITQEQAEAILQLRAEGIDTIAEFELVCRGWQEDDDFQELGIDDLEGVADGEFEDFQLWRRIQN